MAVITANSFQLIGIIPFDNASFDSFSPAFLSVFACGTMILISSLACTIHKKRSLLMYAKLYKLIMYAFKNFILSFTCFLPYLL